MVQAAGALTGILAVAGAAVAWIFSLDRRIAVVENQQKLTADWLERVEAKLDRAIERRD